MSYTYDIRQRFQNNRRHMSRYQICKNITTVLLKPASSSFPLAAAAAVDPRATVALRRRSRASSTVNHHNQFFFATSPTSSLPLVVDAHEWFTTVLRHYHESPRCVNHHEPPSIFSSLPPRSASTFLYEPSRTTMNPRLLSFPQIASLLLQF